MVRRSASAKARVEAERGRLESELQKFQQMVRDLRSGSDSLLTRTKKQRLYHKRILDLKSKLEHLGG
jgi:hypothetical protein